MIAQARLTDMKTMEITFFNRSLSPWLQGALLYLVCFGVLSLLIFATPAFFGTDDYYHARAAAEIIEQRRLALDFPWLPRTILSSEQFVDHHLLYHIYIAPWSYFGGVTGAKLGTVSIAAGVFVAAWVLLRQLGVRYSTLWVLALFGLSTPFLYRMLMIRTQGASLLLLIIALSLLFRRRYLWLMLLAFAYAWLYNGFILMIGVAAAYTISVWLAEKRLEWQPLAFCMLGISLGLLVNPYFPRNVAFMLDHLGAKVDFEDGARVGNEWYPYTTGVLMANSGGALLALALGALRPSFGGKPRDRVETTLLLVALLTLFMVLRSRRFIEYYPAFALLFCAAAWGREAIALSDWLPGRLRFRGLVPAALVGMLALFVGLTLQNVYRDAQDAISPEYFAGASAWLKENAPPGAMIFQTDWDDFTRLFYHNTSNVYLVGLDPTYLELADKALWDEWVEITQGRVSQPSQIILSLFGANYVVSDTRHDEFEEEARDDPNMQLVYEDEYNLVWQVPPPAAIQSIK